MVVRFLVYIYGGLYDLDAVSFVTLVYSPQHSLSGLPFIVSKVCAGGRRQFRSAILKYGHMLWVIQMIGSRTLFTGILVHSFKMHLHILKICFLDENQLSMKAVEVALCF